MAAPALLSQEHLLTIRDQLQGPAAQPLVAHSLASLPSPLTSLPPSSSSTGAELELELLRSELAQSRLQASTLARKLQESRFGALSSTTDDKENTSASSTPSPEVELLQLRLQDSTSQLALLSSELRRLRPLALHGGPLVAFDHHEVAVPPLSPTAAADDEVTRAGTKKGRRAPTMGDAESEHLILAGRTLSHVRRIIRIPAERALELQSSSPPSSWQEQVDATPAPSSSHPQDYAFGGGGVSVGHGRQRRYSALEVLAEASLSQDPAKLEEELSMELELELEGGGEILVPVAVPAEAQVDGQMEVEECSARKVAEVGEGAGGVDGLMGEGQMSWYEREAEEEEARAQSEKRAFETEFWATMEAAGMGRAAVVSSVEQARMKEGDGEGMDVETRDVGTQTEEQVVSAETINQAQEQEQEQESTMAAIEVEQDEEKEKEKEDGAQVDEQDSAMVSSDSTSLLAPSQQAVDTHLLLASASTSPSTTTTTFEKQPSPTFSPSLGAESSSAPLLLPPPSTRRASPPKSSVPSAPIPIARPRRTNSARICWVGLEDSPPSSERLALAPAPPLLAPLKCVASTPARTMSNKRQQEEGPEVEADEEGEAKGGEAASPDLFKSFIDPSLFTEEEEDESMEEDELEDEVENEVAASFDSIGEGGAWEQPLGALNSPPSPVLESSAPAIDSPAPPSDLKVTLTCAAAASSSSSTTIARAGSRPTRPSTAAASRAVAEALQREREEMETKVGRSRRASGGGGGVGGEEEEEKPRALYVKWTLAEDEQLCLAVIKHGLRWDQVEQELPTREYHQCRQRFLRGLKSGSSLPSSLARFQPQIKERVKEYEARKKEKAVTGKAKTRARGERGVPRMRGMRGGSDEE